MGSPVSPIVANLCMEVVEELAINTSTVAPRVWKRYVDDSFVIIKKDAVSSFHDALNSIDPKIAFTIEEENNGQISFLCFFFKSIQIILPSRLYLCENSMTSSIVLTASKIVLPLTYAH